MDTTIENPTIRQRVGNLIAGNGNGHASEIIGRSTIANGQASIFKSRTSIRTIDETVPDYEFWDKLRRGKAAGYSLGGLFSKRIESIFSSWVFGSGVNVRLKEGGESDEETDPRNYTDSLLSDFINGLLEAQEADGDQDEGGALVFQLYEDMLGLGDQYIIVNADGTLSIPSPDTVTVERDEWDYRQIISVTVETKLPKATITDVYTDAARTVTVKEGGRVVEVMEYPNLIGRIPVIHLAYDRSANETNGHSIHEPLRPLYDQYDDTAYKQLDGAKLLGNPLLAFVGMEDITTVVNANEPTTQDTYTDKDGYTDERTQLNIDQNAVLLVGKGGDAKFVAPPTGFTDDTKQALKTLFLLLLDHTGIPEFIWGNELSSSRSTAEVQLSQWVKDIQGRQRKASGWLLKLCKIWLQVQALTDPRIVVDKLAADWPQLIEDDKNLLLSFVQFALLRGLITSKTALQLLQIVDDPTTEIQDAMIELDEARAREFPEGDSAAFMQRLEEGGEDGE